MNIFCLNVRKRSGIQNDFVKIVNDLRFAGAVLHHDHSALRSWSCEICHRLRGEHVRNDVHV